MPRSRSRRSTKPRVSRLPYTGAGAAWRATLSAPMVLVPMREDDPFDLGAAIGQVLEVRNDRVDTGQLGVGEHDSGVHQQEVVLPLQHHRIQAELTVQRDQAERRSAAVPSIPTYLCVPARGPDPQTPQ